MKILNIFFLIPLLLVSFESVSEELRKHVITPKLGTYKMDKANTGGHMFDTSSNAVSGFEYERRFTSGLTIGAEHLHFKNAIINSSSRASELKVDIAFFNSKYYFNYNKGSSWLPFVGLGAGYVFASTNTQNNIDGPALQAFAGITYEWNRVGVSLQYRYVDAQIETSYRYFGVIGEEYDISGKGFSIGVNVKL